MSCRANKGLLDGALDQQELLAGGEGAEARAGGSVGET